MTDAPALPGAHNAQNAAAAAAIAGALGMSRGEIARGLRSYPGLPHRQQRVGTIGGVAFVNDSKATNADAAARALGCYDRLVWIAGGIAKEGGIESLAPLFPRIARALLIGRDAPALAATLAAHGVPHEIAGTLDAAVPAAFAAAARRRCAPVVLLSPACASFDQFTGFDARGDRFAALVARARRARGPPDGRTLPRRQFHARPLVVDRRPLDPGRGRHADRLRLHHDAGGEPRGRRAHRLLARHVHPQAGGLPRRSPAGVVVAVSLLSPRGVRRLAILGCIIALALTAATMVIGVEIKGARRWISLPGTVPCSRREFLKPCFAVVAAWLISEGRRTPRFPGRAAGVWRLPA